MIFCIQLHANEFIISSFKEEQTDISARQNKRTDSNGETCALIKVRTTIEGINFDSNLGIVGMIDYAKGDYWVYVSPGEKRLEIYKSGFQKKVYDFPVAIKPATVYIMEVSGRDESIEVGKDLCKITFRLNEADVYIARGDNAPVKAKDKTTVFNLPKGNYKYTFSKNGFQSLTKELNITVDQVLDISLVPGQNTTVMKMPGIVIISSEPAGAEVFLNGQKVGITPFQDEVIAGEYSIMLSKNMYNSYSASVVMAAGETKDLPVMKLVPKFGYISITSSPAGAKIFLDNQMIGNTPLTKQLIESGSHKLKTELDLYHSEEQPLQVNDGDEKNLTFTLKPAFGSLVINSEPQGAELYIDNQPAGKTPYRNEKMASRNYFVKAQMELWVDAEERIEVIDGQKTEILLVLAKNYGGINITAPQAEIFIEGKKAGQNQYSSNLSPGKYVVTAKREKHRDAQQEVFISIGKTETITLTPEPIMGSISIFSEPSETKGAEIYIDGENTGKVTPAVIPLFIGEHTVALKHKEYLADDQQITITEGESRKLTFTMKNGMDININSNPQGASLFIDSQSKGTTPQMLKLSFGSHSIKLVNGKKTVEETITVSQYSKTSFTYDVQEGIDVTITSTPAGASLYVDGQYQGTTPKTLKLSFGSYSLKLVNGKRVVEETITVSQNGKSSFGFEVSENTFTDVRDSKTYKIVKIGNQVWMAGNLAYKPATGNYWAYDNNTSNISMYGYLYDWATAQVVCTAGWHLPSDAE
ncbi:MAG: PEGA domain-containing protein, partial [Elusimicrobiota bacterium]